jgi:UDP-glucose 4-epimerase
MHPRTVIFGGTGFIGSHLAEELIKYKYPVTLFARSSARLSALPALVQQEANFVAGDFRDGRSISWALDGCELAIHAISSSDPRLGNIDPIADVESNLVSMIQFLEYVKSYKVKHVMFISSGGTVYGRMVSPVAEDAPTNPICSYGIVKLAMENYLRMYSDIHGFKGTIVRLANPYGERQSPERGQGLVAVLLDRVSRGLPVYLYGAGSAVRDFIYVGDAVKAMRSLLEFERTWPPCEVFNVGTGVGTSIAKVLEYVQTVTGKTAKIEYVDVRSVDVEMNILDIRKIILTTGWMPNCGVLDGINKTWQATNI